MKKLFSSMIATALAAFAFTACEDVPSPYPTPQPGEQEEIVYTGSGTKADPYTTADAIAFAKSLSGNESDNPVYIKGKVVEITEAFSTQYGNGTFTISDDGTASDVFTAYRVLYLGNKKYTSSDTQIQVGDDVVLYGNVVNFKGNTPETVQGTAYLYSLNGIAIDNEGGGESTPSGEGTLESPYNAAAAIAYAKTVGETESDKEVYIAGKVASITQAYGSTTYGTASFTITDDGKTGGSEFTIWRAYYLGNKQFATGDTDIQIGDDVVVYGKVVNFRGNTPETVQNKAYLYSLNGVTEGGNEEPAPTPSGKTIEAGSYLLVYTAAGTVQVATPVAADKDYGYMYLTDAKVTDGKLDNDAENMFTFTAVEGGFTLQDASGRYYYNDDSHKSFQVSSTLPTSNYIWTATVADDGTVTIQNTGTKLIIQYLSKYKEFTSTDNGDGLPLLKKPGDAVDTGSQGGGGEQGGGEQGGGDASGNTISIAAEDFGFADKAPATSVTLSDGTTIAFDKNTGSTAPTYYAGTYASVRVYANNTITITASKTITKIAITTTDPYQSDKYNGSDGAYAESGSTKVNINKESDTSVSFSGLNGSTVKITNYNEANSKNQLRIKTMVITYAE